MTTRSKTADRRAVLVRGLFYSEQQRGLAAREPAGHRSVPLAMFDTGRLVETILPWAGRRVRLDVIDRIDSVGRAHRLLSDTVSLDEHLLEPVGFALSSVSKNMSPEEADEWRRRILAREAFFGLEHDAPSH